jgi:ArsR family transcriptional regulator
MGATKYQAYTQKQIEYAKFFKALGHPARIAVLENLMKSTDFEAGFDEIFADVDIAQSTKSQHIQKLTELGIVRTKLIQSHNKSCVRYRVNKQAIDFVKQFLDYIYENIDWNINYLGDSFYSPFQSNREWLMSFRL